VMDLRPIVANLPINDARAALYYAIRYFKQAGFSDHYPKDIFDEDERSAPNETIRALTLALIKSIEDFEGQPAAEFSSQAVGRILDPLATVDAELEAPPSEGTRRNAEAALQNIVPPPAGVATHKRLNR
jgi:hypothetical protein